MKQVRLTHIIHQLKCDPEPFQALWDGLKTHEVRWNDRDYTVGDTLWIKETTHSAKMMAKGFDLGFTGRWIERVVTHVLEGGQFGLEEGFVVLSLAELTERPS